MQLQAGHVRQGSCCLFEPRCCVPTPMVAVPTTTVMDKVLDIMTLPTAVRALQQLHGQRSPGSRRAVVDLTSDLASVIRGCKQSASSDCEQHKSQSKRRRPKLHASASAFHSGTAALAAAVAEAGQHDDKQRFNTRFAATDLKVAVCNNSSSNNGK